MAAVVAVASWRPTVEVAVVAALLGALSSRRLLFGAGLLAVALLAVNRASDAYESLEPGRIGRHRGWATVVDDPRPAGGVTRLIVQIEGERFELWVRGRAAQLRVDRWHSGDRVWLDGEREPLDRGRAARVAWQHVVGEFAADTLGDRREGRPLAVAANRVRAVIADAMGILPEAEAALARGLVIGDDSDQPDDMFERFRASGLAHLTAVSGQNVALALAAAGPLLRRLSTAPRLAGSVALIGWFVLLTRAEPSVLRAGAMATLCAVAFAFGRERDPPRLLAVSVVGLLLIDPLLVLSVGFWLSVGATAGVTTIAPVLVPRLRWAGPLALPLAVTLGAQLGVALPSLLVFGRLSLVGIVANLVAVPVAGLVMLYGLPAALATALLPVGDHVVMFPVGVGVRIVDAVAKVGAAVEPSPAVGLVCWVLIALVLIASGVRTWLRTECSSRPASCDNGARHGCPSADR